MDWKKGIGQVSGPYRWISSLSWSISPPPWDASPLQGHPHNIKFAKERSAVTPRLAWLGVQGTNYLATMPNATYMIVSIWYELKPSSVKQIHVLNFSKPKLLMA